MSTVDRPVDTAPAVTALRRKDLLGIADLSARGDLAHPRYGRGHEGDRHPPDQESAGAARQDGDQPLLRAEHAHTHLVRDCRKAFECRHPQHRHRQLQRRQGRDAGGHGAQPRGDVAAHDRAAALLVRCVPSAVAHLPFGHRQRRRRHARASDAGAARRVHDSRAQDRV